LVSVEGDSGKEIAKLRMAGGRVFDVPLANLSEADQEFAKATLAEKEAPAAESVEPSVFKKALEGKLVKWEGRKFGKYTMEAEPQYFAFYFSAHWCPPCRAFTPDLVKFYNRSDEAAGKKFEIIFVSSDRSEEQMEEYFKEDKMPWPAIEYADAKQIREVSQYAGSGIPCLVLVDRAGKVISDSYVDGQYVGPAKVMDEIEKKIKE
jgi:nucleoredoxin